MENRVLSAQRWHRHRLYGILLRIGSFKFAPLLDMGGELWDLI
jgi:hypothetical protein